MTTATWMQPSFAGGELAPSLAARVDHEKYHVGCRTMKNFFPHAHGGASNRSGTYHVASALSADSVLIPFQFSTTDTYMLEFGNLQMRVLKNGALVESSPGVPLVVVSPYTISQAAALKDTQSNDTLFFTHPDVRPYTLTRASDTSWTFTATAFTASHSAPSGLGVSPAFSATDTWEYRIFPATVSGPDYAIGTESTTVSVAVPNPFANGVELFWTAASGATHYLIYRRKNGGAWAWVAVVTTLSYIDNNASVTLTTVAGGPVASPGLYSVEYVPQTSQVISYRITLAIDGEESQPSGSSAASIASPWPANAKVTVTWISPTIPGGDTRLYVVKVYKESRGEWGYIGSVDARTGNTFSDDNITPDTTRIYPSELLADFTAANDRPGSVALFQQRLWFGRSNNAPQTVWGSATGTLRNFFARTQAVASDPVEAALATTQLNDIRHIVPMDRLILLTGSSEWVLDSGDNADAISPTAIRARVQGQRGASDVRPIVIGETLLFVQRNGSIVRDMAYAYESDGYKGNDLTILANHLLRDDNVKCWAYQQHPYGLVWVVTTSGQLLTFTYLREHNVYAWARHETDGTVKWVGSLPTAGDDEVYFVVERSTGSFLERLAPRLSGEVLTEAFFVDCGKSYTSPGTTVTGLSHLNGKTVAVLADGDTLTAAVSGGQIVLPRAYARVHVGLPYTCDLETMNLELRTEAGTAQGKKKCVKEVTLRLENTRQAKVGPDATKLTDAKFRTDEDYDAATRLFTGDKETKVQPQWGANGRIFIRCDQPVPITVLAVFAEVDLGQ